MIRRSVTSRRRFLSSTTVSSNSSSSTSNSMNNNNNDYNDNHSNSDNHTGNGNTTTATTSNSFGGKLKSLALSAHFHHPDLGMKDHEILSRGTAFLLSVDPPSESQSELSSSSSSSSNHTRNDSPSFPKLHTTPAGGPKRDASQLSWLEFCPIEHRPRVHVVCASHVLSPWLWRNYYPHQDWLSIVNESHVTYSLDVILDSHYDNHHNHTNHDNHQDKFLVKRFPCHPHPIHHPNQMDLAIIHLQQEESALKHILNMGVEVLHLASEEETYHPNQQVYFHGWRVAEEQEPKEDDKNNSESELESNNNNNNNNNNQDDERVFFSHYEKGNLIAATPERFLAKTTTPLPEGVCGGPVLFQNIIPHDNTQQQQQQQQQRVVGVVEGIVPINHENEHIRGAAAFLPANLVRDFIENYAERYMLQGIFPDDMFQKVVEIKDGKGLTPSMDPSGTAARNNSTMNRAAENNGGGGGGKIGGGHHGESSMTSSSNPRDLDKEYDSIMSQLSRHHSPQEIKDITESIRREREEVLEILSAQGGDLDDIIAQVKQASQHDKKNDNSDASYTSPSKTSTLQEAEIVNDLNTKKKE